MSWEVWGTPPDPEPETGFMVPKIGPRQQWCCANGCGACSVKTIDFAWRTITNMRTGTVQRDTYPLDVSSCCGADLTLWDDDAKTFADFAMVDRPLPANAQVSRQAGEKGQEDEQ